MKKLLLLLLFPLMMFAQDTTLIGDVDCSGEVNSQDASLILQFVTNVIDELPCEANMTGLTPEQLQEMIDMMEDQLNINYTGGCNTLGNPEEIFVSYNSSSENIGYVYQASNDGFLTGVVYLYSNNAMMSFYCDSLSQPSTNRGTFRNPQDINGAAYQSFNFPIKKDYYYYFLGSGNVSINSAYFTPLECEESTTTTTNSVAETGGSAVDILYPDGVNTVEPVLKYFSDVPFIIPTGRNLYITTITGYVSINNVVFNPENYPLIASEGDEVYGEFYGFYVDKTVDVVSGQLNYNSTNNEIDNVQYEVPENTLLVLINVKYLQNPTQLLINGTAMPFFDDNYPSDLHGPLIFQSGDILSAWSGNNTTDHFINFNGYLVDEDYFSSAGSGETSAATTSSVSTFGDTLFVGNESYIIPGISYNNIVPEFGSVTDIDGNVYPTLDFSSAGGGEWMSENLRVTSFSNGDPINVAIFNYNGGNLSNVANQTGQYSNYFTNSYHDVSGDVFYNGFTVQDNRNVCPEGWHVATLEDLELLLNIFGELDFEENLYMNAGAALKNPDDWFPYGVIYANNYSYMSFVPAGDLDWLGGSLYNAGSITYVWTSTLTGEEGSYSSRMYNFNLTAESLDADINSGHELIDFSCVRCVKD